MLSYWSINPGKFEFLGRSVHDTTFQYYTFKLGMRVWNATKHIINENHRFIFQEFQEQGCGGPSTQ